MVELEPFGDRRASFGQVAIDGEAAGLLAQGDDAGRGKHGHRPGAERLCGVLLGHDKLDAGGQTGAWSHAGTIRDGY